MRNTCVFIGNLGSDIELKVAKSGVKYAQVGLAVSESRKDGDEWKSETTWVDLSFLGKTAENASNVLRKGDTIAVVAKYSKSKYEKGDQTLYSHKFVVDQWSRIVKSDKSRHEADTSNDDEDVDDAVEGEPAPF